MYKAGDKFIIEIEEVFTGKATGYPQYRIKGFDKLVMDDRGLVKLSKYEDKQKQDAEIKVGDEVITKYKDHAVAVRDTYYIGEDREPFTLIWFGTHMSSCRVNELSKTGRHFDQIAEVLAELRGAENDK